MMWSTLYPRGKWVTSLTAAAVASAIPSLLRGAASGPSDLPWACLPWSAGQQTPKGGHNTKPPSRMANPGGWPRGETDTSAERKPSVGLAGNPRSRWPSPCQALLVLKEGDLRWPRHTRRRGGS